MRGQVMKLERGKETNPARDTLTSFSQAVMFRELGIWELVQASGLLDQKAPLMEPL